ncbi:subtilisin-like protein [Lactarius quietus]|nr:subtilisin-like protein [Lactarius quietus]
MIHHPVTVLLVLAYGILAETPLEPRWGGVLTKHAWSTLPEHWEALSYPPVSTTIDLHIELTPQRPNALADALHEVSFPGSPKYGAHLTKEQVAELVAPHPDTLTLVMSWLEHHGVLHPSVSRSHGGGWLTAVGVPVSRANDLLSASYQLYRHTKTNETVLRTISYGLPGELHPHIQAVAPTTYFSSPRMLQHTPLMRRAGTMPVSTDLESGLARRDEPEEKYVSPSFLRWLYETLGYVPAVPDQNRLGIAGFLGQWPNPADLTLFMNEYRTDQEGAAYTVVEVGGGGYDPSKPDKEANIDVQYVEAFTAPTKTTFYSTGGDATTTEPYLNWLNQVLTEVVVPQTVSLSYGGPEDAIAPELTLAVCRLFTQLGARGASVLISTGDLGVGGEHCTDKDGNVRFRPEFPATCPYVTSVGGTTLFNPEEAAAFSGGGFSNHFQRPDYQDDVVGTFLKNLGSKYQGLYNAGGRGIPDISTQAVNFVYVYHSEPWLASGTSCSVPTAASIISLLNDYRMSKGKRPLGFLNYWLYGGGLAGLNDTKSGSNPGCGTDGFSAITGWDPVTGLGTPNFTMLEELVDDLR